MIIGWKQRWEKLKINRNFQIAKRILICFVILSVFYLVVIWLLTPPKEAWPVFSLKTGEFSCDTNEECVKMAKEKTIKEWENQKQLFEYIDRWSQFVGFSILPLRYEISLENRSYNQIETTGPIGEKRQLPAKVVCDEIKSSMALNDIYHEMEILLQKFDGCNFDFTYMNYSVNTSLHDKKLVVGANENFILSNEREFRFSVELDNLSLLFIMIQSLILLPVLLLGPKPVFKFISNGKSFFNE